jgi:hypothetical protein
MLNGFADEGSPVTETESRSEIAPGTPMRKIVPPRLVGPYLTGQRDVLAGYVYRADDLPTDSLGDPAAIYQTLGFGYAEQESAAEAVEYYIICWLARPVDDYEYRDEPAGVPEFFIEPIPIPVGASMRRVRADSHELVAQYDGLAWQQVDEEA